MSNYKHVLLVTDLRDDASTVFESAKYILEISQGCRLSVLHIVEETVLTAGYEIVPIVPIGDEGELTAKAQKSIKDLLTRYQLKADVSIDTALSTHRGILNFAKTTQPDLIIIGRHTRKGLSSLLGSTADDILPDVQCDVLVVKLGEPV